MDHPVATGLREVREQFCGVRVHWDGQDVREVDGMKDDWAGPDGGATGPGEVARDHGGAARDRDDNCPDWLATTVLAGRDRRAGSHPPRV